MFFFNTVLNAVILLGLPFKIRFTIEVRVHVVCLHCWYPFLGHESLSQPIELFD